MRCGFKLSRYRDTSIYVGTTYVHTRQLRPDLREDADVGPVDHIWFEELDPRSISVIALKFTHVFDVLEFLHHKGAVRVAFSMDEGQDGVAFFPAVLAREPTGRFGQEAHADEQQDGRDHLQPPRNAECRGPVDLGAAVGDVEHDHDTPGDGPLLSSDKPTSLAGRRELRDIYRNLGGADADAEAVDEAADD